MHVYYILILDMELKYLSKNIVATIVHVCVRPTWHIRGSLVRRAVPMFIFRELNIYFSSFTGLGASNASTSVISVSYY